MCEWWGRSGATLKLHSFSFSLSLLPSISFKKSLSNSGESQAKGEVMELPVVSLKEGNYR